MSKILYKPYWKENRLLAEVRFVQGNWVKGWKLNSLNKNDLEKFIESIDLLILNSVPSYNSTLISKLCQSNTNYVFKQNELIAISNRAIFPIKAENRELIINSIRELKEVKLIIKPNSDNDLFYSLNKLTDADFERELIFEITNRFDAILKENPQFDVDRDFIQQFYASTNKPLDLVKFVFFTMSRIEPLKKHPLFIVLFSYLSDSRLDRLYDFLKK